MKYWTMILLAGFTLVPLTVVAKAADMGGAAPVTEQDISGIYLRGDLGGSYLNWSGGGNSWAFIGDAGIGYQFDQNFRADLTYNRTSDFTPSAGNTLSTSTIMANGYYDWKNESSFTPYLGAGLGYGWQWGGGAIPSGQGIAVGLKAGVAYEMTNNLALDIGYRFNDILAPSQSTPEHQVAAGLRVKF